MRSSLRRAVNLAFRSSPSLCGPRTRRVPFTFVGRVGPLSSPAGVLGDGGAQAGRGLLHLGPFRMGGVEPTGRQFLG
jgi:hypothetical protein